MLEENHHEELVELVQLVIVSRGTGWGTYWIHLRGDVVAACIASPCRT